MKAKRAASRGFAAFLLVALALAIFFRLYFRTVVVKGPSMQPTFRTGRRLLVSSAYWLVGPVQDNNIVVVRDDSDANPDGYIIKRVYKMGGEQVDWYKVPRNYNLSQGPYIVPPHSVYLLGDNQPESEDSRAFGPVDTSKILGKVLILK